MKIKFWKKNLVRIESRIIMFQRAEKDDVEDMTHRIYENVLEQLSEIHSKGADKVEVDVLIKYN